MKQTKPIIGVTGGIGSGKSSVARILQSLGAAVIDADELVRDQYRQPEVVAQLRAWWGDAVAPDGRSVDRRAIADIIFVHDEERVRLENYLYPRLNRAREKLAQRYQGDPSVVAIVLDTPKLYEAGVDAVCDAVVFVDSQRALRVQRVAQSRGWSGEELARRENMQKPLDEKRARADYVIDNNSSLDDLRRAVESALRSILAAFNRA